MYDNEQALSRAVLFEDFNTGSYAFPNRLTLVQPQNFGLDGIISVVCIYVALHDHIA